MPSSASVKKRHERGQEGHGRGQEQRESNVEWEYCSEGMGCVRGKTGQAREKT